MNIETYEPNHQCTQQLICISCQQLTCQFCHTNQNPSHSILTLEAFTHHYHQLINKQKQYSHDKYQQQATNLRMITEQYINELQSALSSNSAQLETNLSILTNLLKQVVNPQNKEQQSQFIQVLLSETSTIDVNNMGMPFDLKCLAPLNDIIEIHNQISNQTTKVNQFHIAPIIVNQGQDIQTKRTSIASKIKLKQKNAQINKVTFKQRNRSMKLVDKSIKSIIHHQDFIIFLTESGDIGLYNYNENRNNQIDNQVYKLKQYIQNLQITQIQFYREQLELFALDQQGQLHAYNVDNHELITNTNLSIQGIYNTFVRYDKSLYFFNQHCELIQYNLLNQLGTTNQYQHLSSIPYGNIQFMLIMEEYAKICIITLTGNYIYDISKMSMIPLTYTSDAYIQQVKKLDPHQFAIVSKSMISIYDINKLQILHYLKIECTFIDYIPKSNILIIGQQMVNFTQSCLQAYIEQRQVGDIHNQGPTCSCLEGASPTIIVGDDLGWITIYDLEIA